MRGFRKIVAHRRQFQALAEAVEGGDDHGSLRDQRKSDFFHLVELRLADRGPLVVEAEHGDPRAQHVHRIGVLRSAFEEIQHALRQVPVTPQAFFEGFQLALLGKAALVEEEYHLLVAASLDERVDRVSQVAQTAFGTLHVAEGGFIGNHSFEAFGVVCHGDGWGSGCRNGFRCRICTEESGSGGSLQGENPARIFEDGRFPGTGGIERLRIRAESGCSARAGSLGTLHRKQHAPCLARLGARQ